MEVGWRVERVYCDAEGAVYHVGDDTLQDWGGRLETGVCVHFDQVDLEVFIKHEVKSEYFERMMLHIPARCDDPMGRSERVRHNLPNLREDVSPEVNLEVRVVL